MIALLASFFRRIHSILGITAPRRGSNQRSFVLMWLALIVFIFGFCAFLFYLMIYVF